MRKNFEKVLLQLRRCVTKILYIRFRVKPGWAGYYPGYNWNDPLQPDPAVRDRAKNTSYGGQFRFNINLGLRNFGDALFGITPASTFGRKKSTDGKSDDGLSFLQSMAITFKSIFLDYDKINITLNQPNNATSPGVFG